MTIEEAEHEAKDCPYVWEKCSLDNTDWDDAAAFFLAGYEHARYILQKQIKGEAL